jgi:hypothetical protein
MKAKEMVRLALGVYGECPHYVRDILRKLVPATETSLFAMFKSFLDESGITGLDRASVMAGFMGNEQECDRVAEKWGKIVKPLGEFHACEFFPRLQNGNMASIYKHLSVAEAEKVAIDLIDLLEQSKLEPIGMAIDAEAFRSLHEDERRWMTAAVPYDRTWPMQGVPNNPHFAPFQYCLTYANEYTPTDEKMYITCHGHQQFESTAIRTYRDFLRIKSDWNNRLGETIAFSNAKECPLLQAADLLAYVGGWNVTKPKIEDRVVLYALEKLGISKKYVRAMDTKSIDFHLRNCPFRSTFWKGMTEPDFFEEIRSQGINVLACKDGGGMYRTDYLKRERVRVIDELDCHFLGGTNRNEALEDSTTNTRLSDAKSTNNPQDPQGNLKDQSGSELK